MAHVVGALYRQTKQLTKAVLQLERRLSSTQQHRRAANLAVALRQTKQPDRAAEMTKRAIRLKPGDSDSVLRSRGHLSRATEDARSVAAYRDAVRINDTERRRLNF